MIACVFRGYQATDSGFPAAGRLEWRAGARDLQEVRSAFKTPQKPKQANETKGRSP